MKWWKLIAVMMSILGLGIVIFVNYIFALDLLKTNANYSISLFLSLIVALTYGFLKYK